MVPVCAQCISYLHTVRARCILTSMDSRAPVKVPGAVLAAERDTYGVTRRRLADKLGLHRNTLRGWEQSAELDVLRQRRYRMALEAIVAETTAEADPAGAL
jgi:hypothetical protein